jgi:hypothetical protein
MAALVPVSACGTDPRAGHSSVLLASGSVTLLLAPVPANPLGVIALFALGMALIGVGFWSAQFTSMPKEES